MLAEIREGMSVCLERFQKLLQYRTCLANSGR